MKILINVILIPLILLTYCTAFACTCGGNSNISSIGHSTYDVVFEGKLIRKVLLSLDGNEINSDSTISEINSNHYYVYTFEVSIIYRPEMFNNLFINVYSSTSNGSCGINLQLGNKYIVTSNFVYLEPILEYNPDKYLLIDKKVTHLYTDMCTHTRETNNVDLLKLDSIFYKKVIIDRKVINNR